MFMRPYISYFTRAWNKKHNIAQFIIVYNMYLND